MFRGSGPRWYQVFPYPFLWRKVAKCLIVRRFFLRIRASFFRALGSVDKVPVGIACRTRLAAYADGAICGDQGFGSGGLGTTALRETDIRVPPSKLKQGQLQPGAVGVRKDAAYAARVIGAFDGRAAAGGKILGTLKHSAKAAKAVEAKTA